MTNNSKCVYKGKIAFFYRNSWYHRTKELLEDGSTKYGKLGGFKTPLEAEESYYTHLKKYEDDRRIYIVPKINKEVLLKDYLIYWYENVFDTKVESTTSMVASYTIYNLIIPNLPYNIKVRLTTTDYINQTLEKIDKLGKTTANKSREILYSVFKQITMDNILTVNPVASAKLYKRGKPNITLLSKDEIKKLLAASCDNESWYLEILLALFCGLRKGEIRGLKFSDFNYEKKTVRISRQLASVYELSKDGYKIEKMSFVEKEPKTKNSFRTLKIPNIILEELEKRKQHIELNKLTFKEKYHDNGYISCREDGTPHAASSLNKYIEIQCEKVGIPKITVHGLRHLYATILIEQNVPIHKISALLGHASVHTTFDFYLDIISEIPKITAFMNNIFNNDGDDE